MDSDYIQAKEEIHAGDAVERVIQAGQRLVADRLELMRLEATSFAKSRGVALGVGAIAALIGFATYLYLVSGVARLIVPNSEGMQHVLTALFHAVVAAVLLWRAAALWRAFKTDAVKVEVTPANLAAAPHPPHVDAMERTNGKRKGGAHADW